MAKFSAKLFLAYIPIIILASRFLSAHAIGIETYPQKPLISFSTFRQMVRTIDIPYLLTLSLAIAGENIDLPCVASLVEVSGIQVAITTATCAGPYVNNNGLDIVQLKPEPFDDTVPDMQIRTIVKAVLHDGLILFGSNPLANDIAILFMDEPFQLNDRLKTLSLPEPWQKVKEGELLTILGVPKTGSENEPVPQLVQFPAVSDSDCQVSWYHPAWHVVSNDMICGNLSTAAAVDFPSGCNINGIPIVGCTDAKNCKNYLAGIVFPGFASCFFGNSERYPIAFLEVSHFVSWIKHEVENYSQ